MPPGATNVPLSFTGQETVSPILRSMSAGFTRLEAQAMKSFQSMGISAQDAATKLASATKQITYGLDQTGKKIATLTLATTAQNANTAATNAATTAQQKLAEKQKLAVDSLSKLGVSAGGVKDQLGQLGAKYTYTTDANGNLIAKVKQASVTLDEHGRVINSGRKSWIDYAKGVFSGITAYTLASSAIRFIRTEVTAFTQAAFGLNAMLETNRMAFTNFMGGAKAAGDMLDRLFKFAAVTPFEFPELVDASKKIMAFGFAAEEVIPVLTAVGNAVAGLGSGQVGIERITLALGQMAAKGKVQGQELRQLGEAGIRVNEIMAMVAEKYGMSMAEIMKAQEQGAVKAQDFIDAFMVYSKLKFGDMMMQQSKTFVGAMSTIKDITQMTIAQAFEPLFNTLSRKAYDVAQYLQSNEFKVEAEKIKTNAMMVFDALEKLGGIISTLIVPLFKGALITAIVSLSHTILVTVQSIGTMQVALSKLFAVIAAHPLLLLAGALTVVVLAIQEHNKQIEEMKKTQKSEFEIAQDNIRYLGEEGKAYLDLIEKRQKLERDTMEAGQWSLIAKKFGEWEIGNLTKEIDAFNDKILEMAMTQQTASEMMRFSAWQKSAQAYDPTAIAAEIAQDKIRIQNKQQLSEANSKYAESVRNIIEKEITSGKVSWDTGQKMFQSFKIKQEEGENLILVISAITEQFDNLTAAEQESISTQMGEVFALMQDNVIGSAEALVRLIPIFAQVQSVTQAAADKKVWEELRAAIESFVSPITGLISNLAEAGKVSFAFADNFKDKLGLTLTPADKVKERIAAIASELKDLTTDEIVKFSNDAISVFKDWQSKIIDDHTALVKLEGILYRVRDAAIEAADVKRWQEMGQGIAAAFASGFDEAQKISEEKYTTYGEDDFDKKRAELKILNADILQMEENLRRMSGTAKEHNWTQPVKEGSAQYDELAGKIEKARIREKELNEEIGNMSAANDKAAKSEASKYERMTAALGKYFAKWIWTQEQQGKITQEQADIMLKSTEDIFGASLTETDKVQREFEHLIPAMQEWGNAGLLASAAIAKSLVGVKDPATKAKEEFDKWIPTLEAAKTAAQNLGLDAGKAVDDLVAKAMKTDDPLKAIKDGIAEWVRADQFNKNDLKQVGKGVVKGITDGIKDSSKDVKDTGKDLASWLTSGITGSTVVSDTTGALTGIIGGEATVTTRSNIAKAADNLTEGLMKAIDDKKDDLGKKGEEIAAWITGGLMLGLSNETDKVSKGMSSLVDALVAAAVLRLKSGSPSKVFIDVGTSIGTGMTDGINQSMPESVSAVGTWIQRILNLVSGMSVDPRMEEMSNAIDSAVSAFISGLEAIEKLASYTGEGVENTEKAFQDMKFIADHFVNLAAMWSSAIDIENFDEVSSAMSSSFDAFAAGLDALAKLKDYVSPARTNIDQAIDDLLYIANRLVSAVPYIDATMGDSLASLGSGLASMIEPLVKIRDYSGAARDTMSGTAPAIEAFMADLQGLFGRLSDLASWLDNRGDLKDKMLALGETLTSVMGSLGDALSVLTGIGGYTALQREMRTIFRKEGNFVWEDIQSVAVKLEDFMNDLEGLFGRLGTLADWLDNPERAGLKEKMDRLGPTLTAVISPLKDTLEVLGGIGKYTALTRNSTGIAPLLESFMNDLRGLFGRLGILADWLDAPERAGLAGKIQTLGTTLNAIMSGVKSAVDVLSAIKAYSASEVQTDIIPIMDRIGDAIENIITEFGTWAEGTDAINITKPMLDFAEKLSKVISPLQSVISLVSSVIDLSRKIAEGEITLSGVTNVLTTITQTLVGMIESWSLYLLRQYSDEQIAAIITLSENLSKLLSPLQSIVSVTSSIIDFSKKVQEGQIVLTNVTSTLTTVAQLLVDQLIAWKDTLLTGYTDEQKDALISYAERLSKMISPFQSIISITGSVISLGDKIALTEEQWTYVLGIIRDTAVKLIDEMISLKESNLLLAGLSDKYIASLIAYAENISKIIAPYSTIISITTSILDLVDKKNLTEQQWIDALAVMNQTIRELIINIINQKYLSPLAGMTQDYIDRLIAYAENIVKIISPYSTIISITSSIIGLADKKNLTEQQWINVLALMNQTTRELIINMVNQLYLGILSDMTQDYINRLVQYAKNISDILSPMQTVISITSSAIDLMEKFSGEVFDMAKISNKLDNAFSVMKIATVRLIAIIKSWYGGIIDLGAVNERGEYLLATYAEALSQVLSPMQASISITQTAINLMNELADETSTMEEISSKLDRAFSVMKIATFRLVAIMKSWYSGIIDLGETNEQGEYLLANYADALSKILSPMQTAISVTSAAIGLMRDLADETGSLDDAIAMIDSITRSLVAQMIEWFSGEEKITLPEKLIEFAESLGRVLAPFQTMISMMSGLFDYAQKAAHETNNVQTILPQLFLDIKSVIQQFIDTQWPDVSGIEDDMLNTLNGIVSTIDSTVSMLGNLQEYVDEYAGIDITSSISDIVDDLQEAVTQYILKIQSIEGVDDIEQETANTVGSIVTALGNAISLFNGLRQYEQVAKINIDNFVNALEYTLERFILQIVPIDGLGNEATSKVAQTVGNIISGMGGAIDLFAKLQEYKQVPLIHLSNFIADLRIAIMKFMEQIVPIDGLGDEATGKIAQTVGSIVSAMGGAVDLFVGLRNYHPVSLTHIQDFMNNLQDAIQKFIEQIVPIEGLGDEATGKVAQTVQVIVTGMGAAVDFFKNLRENYSDVPRTQLRLFFDDLEYAVTDFIDEIMPPIEAAGIEKASETGTAVQNIMTALSAAVDFFKKVEDFKNVPVKAMSNLKKAMIGDDGQGGIIKVFADLITVMTGDIYADTEEVSSAISSIVTTLDSAVDFFRKIDDFKEVPAKAMQNLYDSIVGHEGRMGVLDLIQAINTNLTEEVMTAIIVFSGAIESIEDSISAAIDTLDDISHYSAPLPSKFVQFANDMIGGGTGAAATIGILGMIKRVADAWDADAEDAATRFRDAIESIRQPITDAMAILSGLQSSSHSALTNVFLFTSSIDIVISTFKRLASAAESLDVSKLSSKLQSINTTIISTLSGMNNGWANAGAAWIENLINGMRSQEANLVAYLQHIADLLPHSPAKEGPLKEPVQWDSYLGMNLDSAANGLVSKLNGIDLAGSMSLSPAMTGGNIYITISNNTFSGEADEDRVVRKLTQALKRQGVAV